MPDEHISEGENRAYWRGRTDTRLENIEVRLCGLEDQINISNTKLEYIRVCVEKRSRTLYAISGGIAVLYVLLQIVTPIILRLVVKP